MRLLLDENVHGELPPFLSHLGHDVKLAPKGFGNGRLFEIALKDGRMLLTRDSDLLSDRYKASKHSGIVLLRIDPRDIESQKREVSKSLQNVPEEKTRGRVFTLREDGAEPVT